MLRDGGGRVRLALDRTAKRRTYGGTTRRTGSPVRLPLDHRQLGPARGSGGRVRLALDHGQTGPGRGV
ncbi:hypothetical protein, partial [Streptomyces sp. SID2563]|uniref:hypothetical protein n=1 Tax=Streptomyces sp. SID2563 TaxID=2690255 RepID=UPI001F3EA4C0